VATTSFRNPTALAGVACSGLADDLAGLWIQGGVQGESPAGNTRSHVSRTRSDYNPNMNSARPADTKMTWCPSTVNEIGAS